jgi:hypothetical protein
MKSVLVQMAGILIRAIALFVCVLMDTEAIFVNKTRIQKASFYLMNSLNCFADAECGGILKANKTWQFIQSPGFDENGYEENQKCSWLLQAPRKMRIMIEFEGDFGFLCSTSCADYIELKLGKDQRLTGPRFCCHNKPTETFISDTNSMAVIFRSQYGEDRGFRLRFKTS